MGTEFYYKDGGAWRKAKELYYRDSGVWRKLKEAWYRDGGTWRKVFSSAGPVPLPGGTASSAVFSGTATAFIQFTSAGHVTFSPNSSASHDWYLPNTTGIGSSYWIKATLAGGVGPTSGTLNTWLSLAAAQTWSNSLSTNGNRDTVLTIQIASDSSGSNIVTSGTYEIYVEKGT